MQGSKDVLGDFDFSRSDHLWALTVPAYSVEGQVVFYHFLLKNLVTGQTYATHFRYNELKDVHERLEELSYELPPFPVTHFWVKTNKNPQLIQERRKGLQNYFSRVINDPYIRGYPEVKTIIAMCKRKQRSRRRLSEDHKTVRSERTRCHSQSKSKGQDLLSREEWRKLRRTKGKR